VAALVMCVDTRRSSCWVSMVDDRCEGSAHSHITKAECCASVGQAWGSPCEKCPYAELIAATGQATAGPFGPSIAPGHLLTYIHTAYRYIVLCSISAVHIAQS